MPINVMTAEELSERLQRIESKLDAILQERSPQLLTATEAAEYLSVSRSTIDRYTASGQLQCREVKTGTYSKKYYNLADLMTLKK